MNIDRSEQRVVRCRAFTTAGWLEGDFHVSKHHALSGYLSHHSFYPVTRVVWAGGGAKLDFFMLARRETLVVVPPDQEHQLTGYLQTGKVEPHTPTFVLPGAWVEGSLKLMKGTRLSDFLDRTTGFVVVNNALVRHPADSPALAQERSRVLLLNPERLVGVTEPAKARAGRA